MCFEQNFSAASDERAYVVYTLHVSSSCILYECTINCYLLFFFFLAKRSLCSVVFTNNRAKNAEQPNMRTSWSVHGNIGCLQNTRRAVDGAVSFEKQYKKILKTYLCHTIRRRRDEESEKQNSHDAVEARSFHVVVVVKTER